MHFLILLSFLGSFGFIRTSAHMIRAQVSWWPGNVETKGGTHIHHMFWGILLLMTMGYLGLSTDMGSPWLELSGIAFGIGLGLTLDEFALWLNLQDVYWSEKGRQSIDAVIVATLMLVVALIGLQFWIDAREAFLLAIGIGGKRFVGEREPAVAAELPADRDRGGDRVLAQGQAPVRASSAPSSRSSGSTVRSGSLERTRGGLGGGRRHRRIPAPDHLGLALVAEHRTGCPSPAQTAGPPEAAGRASAPSAHAAGARARTARRPRRPAFSSAISGSTRAPTSSAVSPPGTPSRQRNQPGRPARISLVVMPSYSP